jgi:protein-disulfide isomerase
MSRIPISRRAFLPAAVGLVVAARVGAQAEDGDLLSRDAVLRDADAPVVGNPDGNLTIVEYFDYQCPYCRKMAPLLAKTIEDDGQIRLVLKDWPIFGEDSSAAARMALAAKFQGKFAAAHHALISYTHKLNAQAVAECLADAQVDVPRATADLALHRKEIDALLSRNDVQAQAFGFPGTPAFIVGTFRVPGVLDADNLRQVIADARKAQSKPQSEPQPKP